MTALLFQFGPYILALIAGAFGLAKWRSSIIAKERAKQAASEAKARDVADQVDNDVGALPGSEARKELGKWAR